jgi:hypothetical protein
MLFILKPAIYILWLKPLFSKNCHSVFTVWNLMLLIVYVVGKKQALLRFKMYINFHIFELGRNAIVTLIKTIIGGIHFLGNCGTREFQVDNVQCGRMLS